MGTSSHGRLASRGVTPIASVAMTRLVTDYEALARFLVSLGFAAVLNWSVVRLNEPSVGA